jgi:pilus assembly protein FimV
MNQGCHYRTDTRGIAVNKQALSLAVFIAGAYPAASSALGLGDIESSSHLNQPLRARIELLSSAPADASQIQVRLASPDVFNRVGVARPDFLANLHFTPTVQGGKPVILVTSDSPMQEPFVNFLLEVSWPQGQLLKEYTVMLDPPVMLQPGNTVAGGEAAVRAEPKSAGTVRRPSAPDAQAGAAPAQQAASAASGRNTYRVKPGDTLFRVASRLQRPGLSNEQMMMALFRANPGAFISRNINNLRSGVNLKAPSAGDVGSTTRAEARRQIRQQNAEWREFRKTLAKNTVPQKSTATAPAAKTQATTAKPADNKATPATAAQSDKARLEVLGSKKDQPVASSAAVAAGNAKLTDLEKQLSLARESLATRQKENDELKSRVTDLESMMSKKNRLIDLRNEQLAGLQKQLADNGIKTEALGDVAEPSSGMGTQTVQPNIPAMTPAPTDQGKDIQTHMANVAGKTADEVLRGQQQPSSSNANGSKPTPAVPTTPATSTPPSATVGQPAPVVGNTPPATPPVPTPPTPLAPPVVKPTPPTPPVVPVAPVVSDAGKGSKTPSPVFADQQDDNDLLGLLTSPLALKIGAGSLALLLLLWLLGRRRKSTDDGTARGKKSNLSAGMDPPVDHDMAGDDFDLVSLESELGKADAKGERYTAEPETDPFGLDGGSAWGETPKTPASNAGNTPSTAGGQRLTGAAEHPEEDDLLTEANVYIAYGLYQQAESELKKGIERNPEKLEYRHKLLECYFVANNREAFDRQAEQFAVMDGKGKENLWKGILEWGRKISPDNVLYRDGKSFVGTGTATATTALGGVAAAVAASVALADDNKPDPVGLDQLDKAATEAPLSAMDDLGDLDLGELDFDDIDLDKLLRDDERPAAQPAVSAPPVPSADLAAVDNSMDDAHDFDLDMDYPFDLDMDETEAKPAVPSAAVADSHAGVQDDDNLLDFITDDMEDHSTVIASSVAANMPEAAPAKAASTAPATNLNLHLDSANVNRILPKDTFYAPAVGDEGQDWLGDIDDALSFLDFPDEEIDLHEAHISTKLDLARAYLDMGDIEGARSTLEEVMVEGNDDQRREAEVLLHQTG